MANSDSPSRSTAAELLLQRVPLTCQRSLRDLYWRARAETPRSIADATPTVDGGIVIRAGTVLSFDTYFGSFFETQWRLHTRLGTLALRIRVTGRGVLRVSRRAAGETVSLIDIVVDGERVVHLPSETLNFRQHGHVFFELIARADLLVLHEGTWVAIDAVAAPIGLAAVFCTFNREPEMAAVLASLTEDPLVLARLARVIVVNQGSAGLRDHPLMAPLAARLGSLLVVIEQANFGGAGGFGRGMLAAVDDPAVDHIVLLDDDIRIEPDSLLRMGAFLSLTDGNVSVGGHMLDSVQPTRLYEAGAVVGERHWNFVPEHNDLDVARVENLDRLSQPRPVHYNGWWCFGLPLRLIERLGMPLPCFIRGDDLEFGLRLYKAGLYTVPVPGIAVWHTPFYLKLGGWQLYYETRNLLITMAMHRAPARLAVTRRMARQILIHLFTYRYYSTALILRGIEDYLRGPSVLWQTPEILHEGLMSLRAQHPTCSISRSTVMEPMTVTKLPRGRFGFLRALLRAISRNTFTPTGVHRPQRLDVGMFSWMSVAHVDHVGLETWWDLELPSLHRSREQFRDLAPRALKALWLMYRASPVITAMWQAAASELTSTAFWRSYLATDEAPNAVSPADAFWPASTEIVPVDAPGCAASALQGLSAPCSKRLS